MMFLFIRMFILPVLSVTLRRRYSAVTKKVKRAQIISHSHTGKRAHFIGICQIQIVMPPHGSASHRSHVSPVSWSW